jgi:competence protein ComEA
VARASRAGHALWARAVAVRDRVRARGHAAWASLLAWRWTALVARCVLGALGLALLAGIGRSALAGGAAPQATALAPPGTSPSLGAPVRAADTAPPAASTPLASSGGASAGPAAVVEDAGAAAASSTAGALSRARATPEDPVVLNQAALEDLRRLPGVGPKRAQAILALRQRMGRFRQLEDLLKVKGIGRSTLRKLRPLVRLDPTSGAAS